MNERTGERTSLPSMSALRAFEAAARLSSFTKAAEELHLTQSAISHQVKDLEAALGTRLFRREGRGLTLTEAGREYLPFVRDGLERLRAGTKAVARPRRRSAVLTVSVSPNFAAKWLVPRLGRFSAAHPDLDLRISATHRHTDFAEDDIDLAVRHGDGLWPHLDVTRLCAETLFPVCSPSLIREGGPLRTLADLGRHPLLHDKDASGWRRWLGHFEVEIGSLARGPVFSDTSLAIDAAIAGQGVALARSALAALDLAAGRLVRPLNEAIPAPFAYWIVCPKEEKESPAGRRFTAWLLDEAGRDCATLEDIARHTPAGLGDCVPAVQLL